MVVVGEGNGGYDGVLYTSADMKTRPSGGPASHAKNGHRAVERIAVTGIEMRIVYLASGKAQVKRVHGERGSG